MTRALVTQLVEALNKCRDWPGAHDECSAAITAAREYLATEPSGERAELIDCLRDRRAYGMNMHGFDINLLNKAADMLEADAQRITELETLSVTNIMLDVVPGDGSGFEVFAKSTSDVVDLLTKMSEKIEDFESSKQAQQVKRVPMTEKQIDKIHADTARLAQIRTTFFIAFARAIEAHHGITPADKPTGWDNGLSQDYCKEFGQWLASRPGARQQIKEMFDEPEDLYALALKADNWGQP